MHYLLFDRDPKMVAAWKPYFADLEQVTILQEQVSHIQCDALVSPANSFGFMDGGIDYPISLRLGWDLQKRLQTAIQALPEGELLIGRSLTIATGKSDIPYLIAAPTMRVPMSFNIDTSVNAYLAMKAALIAAQQQAAIKTLAIPGFCTGCGKMPYDIAAKQMFKAFKEIVLRTKQLRFSTFKEAQDYHWSINENGNIWDV